MSSITKDYIVTLCGITKISVENFVECALSNIRYQESWCDQAEDDEDLFMAYETIRGRFNFF